MPPCASVSLAEPWRLACLKAMGLEDWDDSYDEWEGQVHSPCAAQHSTSRHPPHDAWTTAALQIQANLHRMNDWIRSKDYSSVLLDAADASLIQSTVTSFLATTATELETLRQRASTQPHRLGIATILLDQLQALSTLFTTLSKARQRPAVALWQSPFHVGPHVPFDGLVQQRSKPLVWQDYEETRPVRRSRPKRVWTKPVENSGGDDDAAEGMDEEDLAPPTRPIREATKAPSIILPTIDDDDEDRNNDYAQQQLQQEAILLDAQVSGELDEVQKMEHMMVQIATLLGQFSNLVTEQQEEVWDIYQATTETKQYMEQGQEQLLDAAARTRASRHWKAQMITGMAMMLLIFHWIRP